MLKVATGSDNPSGEAFCFKYPDERACKGIGFLPMLFILPQVNDYANRSVILGLGDIVLPGFLIAFCARHDEAARLIDAHMPRTGLEAPTKWYGGFFFPLMVAYSAGLFLAFTAVLLMEQGQPALLYICPLCLASILILGRKNLKGLWNGAKVFRLADLLVRKTEREWGKARMKLFAEQCVQHPARVEASRRESSPEQSESRNTESTENRSEEPAIPSSPVQPEPKDVCFGNEDHPGTKAFRKVVEDVAADSGEEEFKEIYKIIKKKLKGRRFLKTDDNIWGEATKKETRKETRKAYDHARGRPPPIV